MFPFLIVADFQIAVSKFLLPFTYTSLTGGRVHRTRDLGQCLENTGTEALLM